MKRQNRYILLISSLLLLLIYSCNPPGRTDIDPSEVIPEQEMVALLTDLYLAEGLLNYPPVRSNFNTKDSIENYLDVIKEHGFTKQKVDRSIEFYFIDRPRKYDDIYDKVIENLSGMEADVIQELSQNPNVNRNLWNGERSYNMPDDGVSNPVEFSLPLEGPGVYIVKARITVYEDDQSIDPHMLLWFWYDDGTEEGKKIFWERKDLIKNSRPEYITLRKELNDTLVTHLRGKFLNHTDQPGHWEKHSMVTNIIVNHRLEEK